MSSHVSLFQEYYAQLDELIENKKVLDEALQVNIKIWC